MKNIITCQEEEIDEQDGGGGGGEKGGRRERKGKQGWLQPYKAPCIVESGSCAITTVLSLNAFFIFSKIY